MDLSRKTASKNVRAPEIIRNVPLLTFFLSVDPSAFCDVVPVGFAPHPECHLVLNMWFQPNAAESSGFGRVEPLGVSYLALEVDGEEGSSLDGNTRFPARFWLEHWNSSSGARRYARETSRLHIESGETSLVMRDGLATATLKLGEKTVISASARVGNELLGTLSGHSIYFAECENRKRRNEIAKFTIPWVSDSYSASQGSVFFSFQEGDSVLRLLGSGTQVVSRVTFRRITLVPYLATEFFDAPRRDDNPRSRNAK